MEEKKEIVIEANVEKFPSTVLSAWERFKASELGCPKCGSKSLSFRGSRILGPVPEENVLGEEKVIFSCEKCGNEVPFLFIFKGGGKQINLVTEVLEHLLEKYSEGDIPNYYLFFREMELLEWSIKTDEELYKLNLMEEFEEILKEKMEEKKELFEKTGDKRHLNELKLIFGYFKLGKGKK